MLEWTAILWLSSFLNMSSSFFLRNKYVFLIGKLNIKFFFSPFVKASHLVQLHLPFPNLKIFLDSSFSLHTS